MYIHKLVYTVIKGYPIDNCSRYTSEATRVFTLGLPVELNKYLIASHTVHAWVCSQLLVYTSIYSLVLYFVFRKWVIEAYRRMDGSQMDRMMVAVCGWSRTKREMLYTQRSQTLWKFAFGAPLSSYRSTLVRCRSYRFQLYSVYIVREGFCMWVYILGGSTSRKSKVQLRVF